MRAKQVRHKKIRITIDLLEPAYKRLETLEHRIGATTKAEIIRDALKLYEYLTKRANEGYAVLLRNKKKDIAMKAMLICAKCGEHVTTYSKLVNGSPDPNDKRCPECSSALFLCGYCNKSATEIRPKSRLFWNITWNCSEGCNP